MSGHTPGPWVVTNGTDIFTGLGARNADGLTTDDNDGWYIADCAPGESSVDGLLTEMGYAEAKANARLISAAPELLEVCQRLLDHPLIRITGDVEIPLRRAIAKATGETS